MPIIDQLSGPTPKNLSLEGNKLTNINPFENEGQAATSDIQALTDTAQTLIASQDLISGRLSAQIPNYSYFKPASKSPLSVPEGLEGLPYYPSLGGIKSSGENTYKDLGPIDGQY